MQINIDRFAIFFNWLQFAVDCLNKFETTYVQYISDKLYLISDVRMRQTATPPLVTLIK